MGQAFPSPHSLPPSYRTAFVTSINLLFVCVFCSATFLVALIFVFGYHSPLQSAVYCHSFTERLLYPGSTSSGVISAYALQPSIVLSPPDPPTKVDNIAQATSAIKIEDSFSLVIVFLSLPLLVRRPPSAISLCRPSTRVNILVRQETFPSRISQVYENH